MPNYRLPIQFASLAADFVVSRVVTELSTPRRLVLTFALVSSMSAFCLGDDTKFTTSPPSLLGQRVRVIQEVNGSLRLNPNGKDVRSLPLEGTAELIYGQVSVSGSQSEKLQVRHYEKADAAFTVNGERFNETLAADRRILVASFDGTHARLTSASVPFRRNELDLLDVQFNTAVVNGLVTTDVIEAGSNWSHANELVAALLGLDIVQETTLKSNVVQIAANIVSVEMTGEVEGSVRGVNAQISVKAKYNFGQSDRSITWIAASIEEKREIGHAEPGLDVKSRIRISIEPMTVSQTLSRDVIDKAMRTLQSASVLSCESKAGGFSFVHPLAWRTMVNRHDVTILRLVENGELVAQCNMTRLQNGESKKQLTSDSFQIEIQKALAMNFGRFAEVKEFTSERGLRGIRAVVAGIAADLPVQWIYYHLSDSNGQQATMVFTMDEKFIERFADHDTTFVQSFEFMDKTPESASDSARATTTATAPSNSPGPTR